MDIKRRKGNDAESIDSSWKRRRKSEEEAPSFEKLYEQKNDEIEKEIEKKGLMTFEHIQAELEKNLQLKKEKKLPEYVCQTYAEPSTEGVHLLMKTIFKYAHIEIKDAKTTKVEEKCFVDFGSGFGKPVFAAAIFQRLNPENNVTRCVGIEYNKDRHLVAEATQKFVDSSRLPRIDFVNADIVTVKTTDFFKGMTHAFSFDILFPKEVLRSILLHLRRAKSNVWVSCYSVYDLQDKLGEDVCVYSGNKTAMTFRSNPRDSFIIHQAESFKLQTTGVDEGTGKIEEFKMYVHLLIH